MSRNSKMYNDTELSPRAASLYLYLQDRADKEGTCFPGVKTIAKDMKRSPRTVQRAVNDLVKAGYLQRDFRQRERNHGQTSNLYTILPPRE